MTLHLPADLLTEILAHCTEEHPREACGVLAGHDDRPVWLRRMANVAAERTSRYAFDADEQVDLYRGLDELGLDPVVIYHSHTASAAVPSRTDVTGARDTNAHYVIVSTRVDPPEVRSYRLFGAGFVEEPVEVMATCG